MGDPSPIAGRLGKRCVVFGCSNTNKDGVYLHFFPLKNNDVCRKWNSFVTSKRKNWAGATKHSVICSKHSDESCYPAKYKIMESLGQSVRRKDLLPDAVLSIHASEPNPMSNITETPKKQRMAFTKRENARILSQHFQATELMEIDQDVDYGSNNTMVCGMESDNSTPHTPSGSTTALTRTYGCQVGLKKPARRSKKIQTSFKTHNQICQTTSNECKSVAIQCDIMKPEQTSNTNMCEDHNLTFDHDGTEDNGDQDDDSPQEDLFDSLFNASFQSEADEDVDCDSDIDDERDEGRDRMFLVNKSELLKLISA
ncbi:THAP domain-containing protein 10-like [Ylistrum balloti]|uniref:THAP domain-containing protein 10-like n=1 Tax=Ylistrum balloti TaxID=509963 RepID=UPI00290588B8|nr:THAP domain-containing protein 10-like [Ylistrum balloti]